jgi:hypothetical protein
MIEKHNLSVTHGCGMAKIEHPIWTKACLLECSVMLEYIESRSLWQPLQPAQNFDDSAISSTASGNAKNHTNRRQKWNGERGPDPSRIFQRSLSANQGLYCQTTCRVQANAETNIVRDIRYMALYGHSCNEGTVANDASGPE